MKLLTLLRHARTQTASDSGADVDRRLDESGRLDAANLGQHLRELGPGYDLILSSPAIRAMETATLAGLEPKTDPRIYDASAGDLLAIAEGTADDVRSLLVIGHNPGMERLASLLTRSHIAMPTATMVELEIPVERWNETGSSAAALRRYVRPDRQD